VRTHALLGGLLDVEVDRRPGVADADRHPEPVPGGPRLPRRGQVEGPHVAETEQVVEVGCAGQRVLADGSLARVQRCKPAGERLGGRQVELVAGGAAGDLAGPERRHRGPAVGMQLRLDVEAEPGRVVELLPALGQVQHGHAVHALLGDEVVAGRQRPAVDDHQDVRW
jgi:hypothetical protein